ncbi:hypothetical protein AB7W30_20065 [Providencia manganoxydans]|uniref:hypothetical protein n=1 Tax=Providencia manganoxydans TaxID=2923283 RepID=UPI0032DB13D2
MKIVDRTAFLKLPANTVYSLSDYKVSSQRVNISGLYIKGDTVANVDYYEQSIPDFEWDDTEEYVNTILAAVKDNIEIDVSFNSETKNGLFDAEQMYVVWSKNDISSLIERLKECL